MDLTGLEKILENEPRFRLKQAKEAVFKQYISNWNEATFLPLDLREKLNKECPLDIKADVLVSRPRGARLASQSEAAIKAKITLKDGMQIETVLMRHKDQLRPEASGRNTVCVSCQVGCPMGCLFCATGKMGFKRNLSSEEILEQVIFFGRYLKKENPSTSLRVTNVTYMGMGEPFLNYDNVLASIRILNNKDYFNIGARSISVSTCGIVEGIEKFSKEGLQLNLAISLHAPNNELRGQLMPINKKYSLDKLFPAIDEYIKITKRKVMFEYVLIKDVNDSEECARQLAKMMSKKLYFVNLILYNATGIFKPSTTKQVEVFKKILKKEGINFVQRYRFGDDIQAACGQFITSK